MTALALQDIRIAYGDHVAVDGVTLSVAPGELHAVVGVSGAGKTSLLRAVAGFERVTHGSIAIDGHGVDGGRDGAWTPPELRGVGVVFQDYALFPHLTVAKNVAFGMRGHTMNAVAELLAEVGLAGFEERLPAELSGGEQQRVALARALGASPRLLLLDEPFAHLDPARRDELRASTRHVIRHHRLAALMVTHDAADALGMADIVHVMHEGRLLQSAPPATCYDAPADRVVAAALGPLQTLPCVIDDEGRAQCVLGAAELTVRPARRTTNGALLVRPEALSLLPPTAREGVPARVLDRMVRGADVDVRLRIDGGVDLLARVRRWDAPAGEHIRVRLDRPCALLAAQGRSPSS